MWGEPGGQVNGNGLGAQYADTFYVSKKAGWATPTAWSITGLFNHHFSPSFSLGVEGSYGQLNWSNTSLLSNDKTWIVGGVAHWDPVANLDFEFELLYQNTKLTTPGDYTKASVKASGPFPSTSDGFAARFEVTRAF